MEESVDKSQTTSSFNPRKYQLEIFDKACQQNTLAFLPTGSGKTFISILLINYRLREIRESHSKQVIAFLAPTKVLVGQQRRYISGNCSATVRAYTGDTQTNYGEKVDDWSSKHWINEFKEVDIMVMTSEILRQILFHNFLPLSSFNTIILDECHHAFGNNPMAGVCNLIRMSDYKPHILGMTASPIPCKKGSVMKKIQQLEETTMCMLVAPKEALEDLKIHVPVPTCYALRYDETLLQLKEYVANKCVNASQVSDDIDYLTLQNNSAYDELNTLLYQDGMIGQIATVCSYLTSLLASNSNSTPSGPHLSMQKEASMAMYHAFIRIRHAVFISDILKTLRTLGREGCDWEELQGLSHQLPRMHRAEGERESCDKGIKESLDNSFNVAYDDKMWLQLIRGFSKCNLLLEMQQLLGKLCCIAEECGVCCALHALSASLKNDVNYSVKYGKCSFNQNERDNAGKSGNNGTSIFSWFDFEKQRREVLKERSKSLAESSVKCIDLHRIEVMKDEIISGPFQNSIDILLNSEIVLNSSLLDCFASLCVSLGSRRCKKAVALMDEKYAAIELQFESNYNVEEVENSDGERESVRDMEVDMEEGGEGEVLEGSTLMQHVFGKGKEAIMYDIVRDVLVLLASDSSSGIAIEVGSNGMFQSWGEVIVGFKSRLSSNQYAALISLCHMDLKTSISFACDCILESLSYSDMLSFIWCNPYGPHSQAMCYELLSSIQAYSDNNNDALDNNIQLPLISTKVAATFRDLFSRVSGPAERNTRSCISLPLPEGWCAVVFCKMRLTAVSLCLLLQTILGSELLENIKRGRVTIQHDAELMTMDNFPYGQNYQYQSIRPQYLIGGYLEKLQNKVLFQFKSAMSNVLFATDVAEEGLDVRACQLVINFDCPDKVKSFIQRRGRARAEMSQMITLIPLSHKGNNMIRELRTYDEQEKEMNDIGRDGMLNILAGVGGADSDDSDENIQSLIDVSSFNEKYTIDRTGASIDAIHASQLLLHYCQKLPHDKHYNPDAIFWMSKFPDSRFQCSILLPQVVPPSARCVIGERCSSKAFSKSLASLAAIKALHAAGEIDDWLVPLGSNRKSLASWTPSTTDIEVVLDRNEVETDPIYNKRRRLDSHEMHHLTSELCLSSITDQFDDIKIDIKIIPNDMHPNNICNNIGEEGACKKNAIKVLHLYACSVHGSDLCMEHVATECCRCSWHLKALNSFGIAFIKELPVELIDSHFTLTLRDILLEATIEYLGQKQVSMAELKEMQRFHRSVLCREYDENGSGATPTPMDDMQWTSGGSTPYYVIFPMVDYHHNPNIHTTDSWECYLKHHADEAQTLAYELKNHKMSLKRNDRDGLSGIVSDHSAQNLIGKLFSRANNIYIGLSESPLTLTSTFLIDQKNNNVVSKDGMDQREESESALQNISYADRLLMKGRLSESEVDYLLAKTNHKLVSGVCMSGRMTLVPLLQILTITPEKNQPHNHATMFSLVPEQCKILGSAVLHLIGIVAPSVIWRFQSLILAAELRTKLTRNHYFEYNNLINGKSDESYYLEKKKQSAEISCKVPSVYTILESITPRMCSEVINSERLEFLGDIVLKYCITWAIYCLYPEKHEGQLTSIRQHYINNVFLSVCCHKCDIVQYMRALKLFTGKQMLKFPPPGKICYRHVDDIWNSDITKLDPTIDDVTIVAIDDVEINLVVERDSDEDTLEHMSSKTHAIGRVKVKHVADMFEALLGAFYIGGGLLSAIAFIKAMGAWPTREVKSTKTLNIDEKHLPPVIPQNYPIELTRLAYGPWKRATNVSNDFSSFSNKTFVKRVVIDAINMKFGYEFKNYDLLHEALTHCSYQGSISNQRLEFLGDAVLDLAVVSMIYRSQPESSDPSKLTVWKSKATCNARLASAAVRLEMYKYLNVMSPTLIAQFGDLQTWHEMNINKMPSNGLYEWDLKNSEVIEKITESTGGSKALADVMESVFGAIFIDSGSDFSTLCSVVQHLQLIS